jgi:outer membrane protein assembly factor BamB
VIRVDGSLVWFDALDKSPKYFPSFGDFDGDGRSDMVAVGYEDGIRCYEMASGKIKWRMPYPLQGLQSFGTHSEDPVKGTASADLDGDGRDEALIVMNQTLFCIGAPREGSTGEVRWQVDFPTEIGPPAVATLDNKGGVSILVLGSDGYVYCIM